VSRTTPPPEHDVTALFPGIDAHAATATRLHPRRGKPDPFGSQVGGPLRWPAGEPWPACHAEHVQPAEIPVPEPLLTRLRAAVPARDWAGYESVIAELADGIPGFAGINRHTGTALGHTTRPEPVPSAMVAVAQLRVADVPDLPAPAGTDLLQVLWCPNEHDNGAGTWAPDVTVRWRRAAPTDLLYPPPRPAASRARYLPHPCVLHPERVVEYPWWQELPPELAYRVHVWDAENAGLYHRRLSVAPGWKVGGWAAWPTSDATQRYCASCGAAMRQLLQIDSGEWGDPARWQPLEERDLEPGSAEHAAAAEPTGVVAGRTGLYRIFQCASCRDPAVAVDLR
jgi:hypothetical protein